MGSERERDHTVLLKIENLHVRIGEKEVLKGLNLNIEKGETFILFGFLINISKTSSLVLSLTPKTISARAV